MSSWTIYVRRRVGAWRSRLLANLLPFLPRAIWRLLPGTSARFGPPRRWQTWPDYKATHSAGWTAAFPAKSGNFPRPFWPLDGSTKFKDGTAYNWPETGVAHLRHARVVTVHGWCVAPRDTFLGDFSFGGNRRTSFVYSLTLHRAPKPLKGVTLNLCSAHAATNFCHWLLDAMSRLELFHRCGFRFEEVDQILVPHFPGATAAWVLANLNLPKSKLIFPAVRDQFLCETLLQPSYPGFVASYPPWVVDFYRRHFPPPNVNQTRLLYIPRKGKRGLVNEAAVEKELEKRGFEAFEPAGQTDLHVKLADVSRIVGVHGAALANLVFCRPGTRVLELLPSDTPWPFYYSLCGSGNMPYGVIIGKSSRERKRKIEVPTNAPLSVPIDELRSALDVLLSTGISDFAAAQRKCALWGGRW
jgi:hypothetical protein